MTSRTSHSCPTCKKPIQWKDNPYRPFCSQRCKLIDLGEWAAGRFRIPGEKVPEESMAENTSEHEPDDTTHK